MDIITPRLTLKELVAENLEAIHRLHSIPGIDRYNTLGLPASIKVTELLLEGWLKEETQVPRQSYIFSVNLTATKSFIGLIGLKMGKPAYRSAEIWYKIDPDYWHQGYATEVVKDLVKFAFFELGLHRVEAGCAVDNIASIKILEKSGFTREGRKRSLLPIRGHWVDNYFYAILDIDIDQDEPTD